MLTRQRLLCMQLCGAGSRYCEVREPAHRVKLCDEGLLLRPENPKGPQGLWSDRFRGNSGSLKAFGERLDGNHGSCQYGVEDRESGWRNCERDIGHQMDEDAFRTANKSEGGQLEHAKPLPCLCA
jgi:hypothetical protein